MLSTQLLRRRPNQVPARRHRPASGFTLVEITVVMVIMALLTAIIVPVFSTSGQRVNLQTCLNNLHVIGVNLAQYRQDYGEYPKAPLPDYLQTLDPAYLPYGLLPAKLQKAASSTGTPDDLTPSGVYTGEDAGYTLKVKITYTGTSDTDPDQFMWTDTGDEGWTGPFPIEQADASIALHYGVSVRFATVFGHTLNSGWTINLSSNLPDDWLQWRQAPAVATSQAILAGDDTRAVKIAVSDTAWLGYLEKYAPVIIRSGENEEVVLVESKVSGGFTTHTDLDGAYPAGSLVTPGFASYVANSANTADVHYDPQMLQHFVIKNFGLSRLNQLNTVERPVFHCPQLSETEEVIQNANLSASGDRGNTRRFDPLWSGYNTYDVTYNYDQYHNAMLRFDALLGYGDLDASRQLKNANAPADTVVCWCYGHRADTTATFALGDPEAPDLLGAADMPVDADDEVVDVANAREVRQYEKSLASEKVIVLWVDGTVGSVTPRLARGNADQPTGADRRAYYYQVPPFLMSSGDRRQ